MVTISEEENIIDPELPIHISSTEPLVPTILNKSITIEEWKKYGTTTTVKAGIFIPSQVCCSLFTGILVMGVTGVFVVETAIKLHYGVVIGSGVIMLYTLWTLNRTTFTEPGFLPRNEVNPVLAVMEEANDEALRLQQKLQLEFKETEYYPWYAKRNKKKEDDKILSCSLDPKPWKEMMNRPWGISFEGLSTAGVSQGTKAATEGIVKGMVLTELKVMNKKYYLVPPEDEGLKYCHTCLIWRPERSKHCRECDACCQKFDHHCPWTGNCIGLRNYVHFVRFICMVTLYGIYIVAWSVLYFLGYAPVVGEPVNEAKDGNGFIKAAFSIAGVVFLFVALVITCVGGLTLFHLKLLATDRTTAEDIRGSYIRERRKKRKTKGCRKNCVTVCCRRRPPSKIKYLRW